MAIGWIKLWRQLKDSDLWLSEKFTRGQAWIDLLMLANFRDSFFRLRGQRVDVKRGQLAYSELSLAERWHWSRGKVRRFLQELEGKLTPDDLQKKSAKIVQHKSRLTTLISILNYELYQGDGTTDGTTNGTTDGTQEKKGKKNKKGKNCSLLRKERGGRGSDEPHHSRPARVEKTAMRKDFELSTDFIEFALASDFQNDSIIEMFEGFVDHYLGNGEKRSDWYAVWKNWVRRQRKIDSGDLPNWG